MRVALISDLHSSVVPLEAVLADARRAGVDRTVCLGDLIDLGPQPREVIARVRELQIPCVLGNHDVLAGELPPPEGVNAWCRAQLGEEERRFLAALPPSLEVAFPSGAKLLCVHGSPRSFDDQILATTPDAVLEAWLAGTDAAVVAAGHTHVQLLRRLHGRTIVNAGSVGMPFIEPYDAERPRPPRLSPWAEYAIVREEGAQLEVELRRVPFDFDAFARDLRQSGFPEPEVWLATWSR